MVDDRTKKHVRDLVESVSSDSRNVPAQELVALTESATADITIEPGDDTAMVYVTRRRHPAFDDLSPREHEVATLVAAGFSNQQIADALFISLATVKDHVHSIYAKTGFSRRAELITAWLGGA